MSELEHDEVKIMEVLPKEGLLYKEDEPTAALCKPKLLPMKSITLQKMEKMQKDVMEGLKAQELQKND